MTAGKTGNRTTWLARLDAVWSVKEAKFAKAKITLGLCETRRRMTNDGGTFLKPSRSDGDCQSSAKMKNASASESVLLTIDGRPALQDELTGAEKGTNVVFLHTTVDEGDHFQQILAWTLKSRLQKQNQLLHEVTASFRSEK